MTRKTLVEQIFKKESFLCIGLDTDLTRIPEHLKSSDDPIFEFNRQIIEATHDLCVAYKPNLAFYEAMGPAGWKSLERTLEIIPDGLLKLADAKRGDIGNTCHQYAKTFFEYMDFDALTIAPYMGEDSVRPFLEYPGKWAVLLALTSNPGGLDFQTQELAEGGLLFEKVLAKSSEWGSSENLMYVVGATRAERLAEIRAIVPDHFLLVPGVGAQGGSLSEVAQYGMNADCGLLVNSSRGIIYAGPGEDFATEARKAALVLQQEMSTLLAKFS